MKRRSLKKKFVSSMLFITLIVLLITSVVTLAMSLRISLRASQDSMQQLVLMGHLQIDRWFVDKERMLDVIVDHLTDYEVEDREGIEEYLGEILQGSYAYITDIYVTTPSNSMYSAIGSEPEGVDWHTRYWYYGAVEAGGVVYTSPYLSTDPGNPTIITLSCPVTGLEGRDMGVVCIDLMLDSLIEFVNDERLPNTSGRAFLLDESGFFIAHENAAFLPRFTGGGEVFVSFEESGIQRGRDVSQGEAYITRGRDWNGVPAYLATTQVDRTGWTYGFSVPVSDFYQLYYHLVAAWCVIAVVMIALAFLLSRLTTQRLLVPIQSIINAAGALALGDMEVDLDVHTGDELEDLSRLFETMVQGNGQQVQAMQRMAAGDFLAQVDPKSPKDTLTNTLNYVVDRLRGTVSDINESSNMFACTAVEIATAAQHLSSGTHQQAAAVQELSSSLDAIVDNTNQHTKYIGNAIESVCAAGEQALQGQESVKEVLQAAHAIGRSASDISRIIGIIDNLAFQTNILALNAAVEAAHAGPHGKGFAVVADEVRSLAASSAAAAHQISELTQTSTQFAESWGLVADEISAMLDTIAENTRQAVSTISSVEEILSQQVGEIKQIADSVVQVNDVVQLNSATAEQIAATTEQMSAQAQLLRDTMAAFQVEEPEKGVPLPTGEERARRYVETGLAAQPLPFDTIDDFKKNY